MKQLVIATALLAACAMPALADQSVAVTIPNPTPVTAPNVTAKANLFAAEQLVDIVETQIILSHKTCASFLDGKNASGQTLVYTKCNFGAENDPLARPFVHSALVNVATAGLINLGFRMIAPHSKFVNSVLNAVVISYPVVLANNARYFNVGLKVPTR